MGVMQKIAMVQSLIQFNAGLGCSTAINNPKMTKHIKRDILPFHVQV